MPSIVLCMCECIFNHVEGISCAKLFRILADRNYLQPGWVGALNSSHKQPTIKNKKKILFWRRKFFIIFVFFRFGAAARFCLVADNHLTIEFKKKLINLLRKISHPPHAFEKKIVSVIQIFCEEKRFFGNFVASSTSDKVLIFWQFKKVHKKWWKKKYY